MPSFCSASAPGLDKAEWEADPEPNLRVVPHTPGSLSQAGAPESQRDLLRPTLRTHRRDDQHPTSPGTRTPPRPRPSNLQRRFPRARLPPVPTAPQTLSLNSAQLCNHILLKGSLASEACRELTGGPAPLALSRSEPVMSAVGRVSGSGNTDTVSASMPHTPRSCKCPTRHTLGSESNH